MQIKGRAPGKATKKPSKIKEKTVRKHTSEKTSIFYEFWLHFGRLLAPFWEPKCNQKSSEILDAFLEVKKQLGPIFLERSGGMRGVPGEDPPALFGGAGRD